MANLIVEGMNITQLSDDDLATRLRNFGFPCGPIVATTRKVYERKLARILRNEDAEENYEVGDYEEIKSPLDIHKESSWSDDLRRRPLNRTYVGWDSSPSFHSSNRVDVISRMVDQEVPKHPDGQSSLSLTTKLIILFVSIIIMYLVYHNMECDDDSPIPAF